MILFTCRSEQFYRMLAEALNEGIILMNPMGPVRKKSGDFCSPTTVTDSL
ncbi:MAG: hypothetical protein LUQ50_10105 [Methanospirillum sp.]|nr:hypothetical protein [Methanospirillum sp.]MDD1729410.1 hypothetical protein [Methanospirillum sp.]